MRRKPEKPKPVEVADLLLDLKQLRQLSTITETQREILCLFKHLGETIMSAVSEFAQKVNAHNQKIDNAVAGLQGDVQSLTDKITELQNSAGTVTPEDQSLLDAIEARASAIADRLEALDNLTPPAAPPTA